MNDILNQRFGRLVVLRILNKNLSSNRFSCECACDCGNIVTTTRSLLLQKQIRSCGCLFKSKKLNLTGIRFGRLTVLKETTPSLEKTRDNKPYIRNWLCQCDCGSTKTIRQRSLTQNVTKSCGCLDKETKGSRNQTHGLSKTVEYRTYYSITERCYNPNDPGYEDYGRKGINFCDHWNLSFKNFYQDIIANIGRRPSKLLSIDRKNNKLGYTCGHCDQCKKNNWPFNVRWATATEQANNTSRNRFLRYKNRNLTVSQWSRELKISKGAITRRLKAGWSIRTTLTKPVNIKFSSRAKRLSDCVVSETANHF